MIKDLINFLDEEKRVAEQNAKDSQKKTNIEYYNGLAAEARRVKDFILNNEIKFNNNFKGNIPPD